MRVSSKGQVTIPKDLRDLAGIRPNSEVVFSVDGARVIVEAKGSAQRIADRERLRRFMESLGKLEGTGDPSISADDVMRATRDR